eukprot:44574-Pyramimonas_sp.AAC.1
MSRAGARIQRIQVTQKGYLTWLSRAGSTCFFMLRPPREISNMSVPSWNQVFYVSRAPRGYLSWLSRAGTVFLRVQAANTTLVPSAFWSASPWH